MKDETTEDGKYQKWLNSVNVAWSKGWRCETDYIFYSPSGNYHDLSAANFEELEKIDSDGLFLV